MGSWPRIGGLLGSGFALITFGLAAIFGGEPQQGVQLLAAFEVLFRQRGFKVPEADPIMIVVRQALEKARAELGPVAFEAAQQTGRRLTAEQAIALATQNKVPSSTE